MTIATESCAVRHIGNGTAVVFPFTFLVPTAADLTVYTYVPATGVLTPLDASEYDVTGIDDPDGGTVEYPYDEGGNPVAPLTSSTWLIIERNTDYTQDTELTNQGGFLPAVLNDALDRMVLLIQQNRRDIDRAFLVPQGETGGLFSVLSGNAGLFPVVNDNEDGFDFTAGVAGPAGEDGIQGEDGEPGDQIFAQISAPSVVDVPEGSIWIDTDSTDIDLYVLTGGAWVDTGANLKGASGAGTGDMLAATYDPGAVASNVYDVDFHIDGAINHVFTAADDTKLAGIETGATADQTGAEIKTAYEGEADTNAFTDAEKTKLAGVETGATADQTGAEIKIAYEAEADTNAFTDAEKTKLAGVETGATADQTAAEILTALLTVDGAGSGLDADLLDGSSAAAFATAAQGALADSALQADDIGVSVQGWDADLDALAAAGNSGILAATTASFLTADETKLDGVEALADVTDAGNVGAAIHGSTAKATPVDADTMPLIDSAAANVLKKVTWSNIKITLKALFDTLYAAAVHSHVQADVTGLTIASSPEFTAVNVGHATDTTLSRVSAGVLAVEGTNLLKASDIGSTVQGFDVDTLKGDIENQAITGGGTITSKSLGTQTTGTLTLDLGDRGLQHYINGGAHTLAPGAITGASLIDITNNASAGAIVTSGWTTVVGSGFTTTNGHKFRCHASVGNGGSLLIVQALQ